MIRVQIQARLRKALPATLFVHASTMLCALGGALPLASSVDAGGLVDKPIVGAIYTSVRLADTFSANPWRYAALPVACVWLLTPFLRVFWLSAQLTEAPVHSHARGAWRRYRQAAGVYAACVLYAALLVLSAWLIAQAAIWVLDITHDARLQQCMGLLLAAPLLLAALIHAPCLSDLAHAQLARGMTDARGALQSAFAGIDVRACCVRAGCEVAIWAVLALSLVPRLWLGTDSAGTWLLFGIVQLCALAQTALRALWCAWLTEHYRL
jgi:hypothetical protein